MNQAVKKPVIADPKAIAARRVDGRHIIQKVAPKDDKGAAQWRRDHGLEPSVGVRKMRVNFG